MADASSEKGLGIFSKKGLKPTDIKLCIINKFDREVFFQSLLNFGWEQVEEPFEFERNWNEKTLRKAAREHAAEILADLLVEVRDNDYSTNPYNDYVYYTWRSGPNTRGLPPPPSQAQTGYMNQQMQMLAEQQRAIIQQQQMLQRMQMQIPQQPQPIPQQVPPGIQQGQVCARCGNSQLQYMANGVAKCIRCGFMFQWQQQQPIQQRPQMQPGPVPTQAQPPQQPQVQAQIPQVKPPVQPGTPTPPGARNCPKCGNVLTVFPDGSHLCNKCGYTGK